MPPGGYLEELRRSVGKRALIVPGACVAIRDNAGRVLLHRPAEVAELEFFPLDALPGPLQRGARQHLDAIHRRELKG